MKTLIHLVCSTTFFLSLTSLAEPSSKVKVIRSPSEKKQISGLTVVTQELSPTLDSTTSKLIAALSFDFEAKGRSLVADEVVFSIDPKVEGKQRLTVTLPLTKKLTSVFLVATDAAGKVEKEKILLEFDAWKEPELKSVPAPVAVVEPSTPKPTAEVVEETHATTGSFSPRFIGIGVHLGASPSMTSSSDSSLNYGTRTGILGGVFAEVHLVPSWSFQPEILYVQKGSSLLFELGTSSSTLRYKWNYLEFPLLAKWQHPMGDWTPFAATGPYVAFLLSASTNTVSSGTVSSDTDVDTKSQVKGFDYGWYLGGGCDYKLTPQISLTGQIRFGLGLANATAVGESTKLRAFETVLGAKMALN